MMLIKTPDQLTAVLWEGELDPAEISGVERGIRDELEKLSIKPSQLPVVTIGQPEIWRFQDLYSRSEMPPTIKAKLSMDNFFLVRFSCSFRTRHKESSVEWARFEIHLQPDANGSQPLAFDMHPKLVSA